MNSTTTRTIVIGTAATSLIAATFAAAAAAMPCPPDSDTYPIDSQPVEQVQLVRYSMLPPMPKPLPAVAAKPVPVDLAICLDVSGSMQGLIDAARQKIWRIVNEFAEAEPTPELRVALVTYGNDGYDPETGWVQVQTDFTTDLDLVSQRLFELTTYGGTEYVGRVVQTSLNELDWHPSTSAMKLVVVAGNESADQDQQAPFRDVCKTAISRGVMVNAIYCGSAEDNIAPGWRDVAQLADGRFAAIDHNNGTVVIASPFDDELARLSGELNRTYIAFTPGGAAAVQNQTAQDWNAANMNSEAAASRAQTKAGLNYVCSWDLVDACATPDFDWSNVTIANLPEEMQSLTIAEVKQHVEKMRSERDAIRAKIKELSQKRQKFVAAEMERQSLDASKSLDHVLIQALAEQAAAYGISFSE